MINPILISIMLFPQISSASTINTDAASIGTLAGQATSDGITFSSSVYISAGSSLTLQGSSGYIKAASSVTASSFWGDGRQLSDVGILTGTQTFSGANTFISTVSFRTGGRQIIVSTDSTTNNISINGAGQSTFSPFLHIATFTTISAFSTTVSSLNVCVPGSTITLVTGGGRVEINFTGQISGSFFGSASFLQNGQFVGDLSNQAGLSSSRLAGTGVDGFTYLTEILPAGSYSYCLTLAVLSGLGDTVFLIGAPNSGLGRNLFYAKEIK